MSQMIMGLPLIAQSSETLWLTDLKGSFAFYQASAMPGKDLLSVQNPLRDTNTIWRLDRLGRTTKGLCELFEELQERRIDLVSIRDGFSLASPAGRLHARILASVAEYETEVRTERVLAGQAVAKKRGQKWGGSKKGWRWKVSEEQIEEIRSMRLSGKKITHMARATGLSRPTIYKLFRTA